MRFDEDSRWNRFWWHPLTAAVSLVGCVFLVGRSRSVLNIVALSMAGLWFIGSIKVFFDARRRSVAKAADGASEEAAQRWFDQKSALMEEVLGKEHNMVMHALIPYAVGGALDLYYFPNGIPGTAIATKEISTAPDEGSSNAAYRRYELVMFTKHAMDLDAAHDQETAFGQAHATINSILNHLAPYSEQATLNVNETCEFPEDMERVGGKCLIFDGYTARGGVAKEDFGVLAVIEIFRSEMEYAREHGGASLIERLKLAGHYPYSDLDREVVA